MERKPHQPAHTPGPWVFYADVPSTDPNWHIVTTENRLRVLANVHIKPGNQVDLANARLITAAPNLLEALIAARAALAEYHESLVCTEGRPNGEFPAGVKAIVDQEAALLAQVDAAIAKAEGR